MSLTKLQKPNAKALYRVRFYSLSHTYQDPELKVLH